MEAQNSSKQAISPTLGALSKGHGSTFTRSLGPRPRSSQFINLNERDLLVIGDRKKRVKRRLKLRRRGSQLHSVQAYFP